ncbi:MAG: hypothetical protein EXR66_09180 [Dehalococcoidia bacterium]|nr:hypothetical protein [Dehalococcoidia bacterium]
MIPNPTRDEFIEIMRREAAAQRIDFVRPTAADFVDEFYLGAGRMPRGSHHGDILRNLSDLARFEGVPVVMTTERLRAAAEAFFVLDSN